MDFSFPYCIIHTCLHHTLDRHSVIRTPPKSYIRLSQTRNSAPRQAHPRTFCLFKGYHLINMAQQHQRPSGPSSLHPSHAPAASSSSRKYPTPAHIPTPALQALIPRLTMAINEIDLFNQLLAQGQVDGSLPSWYVSILLCCCIVFESSGGQVGQEHPRSISTGWATRLYVADGAIYLGMNSVKRFIG
jgi:hypothetical protein